MHVQLMWLVRGLTCAALAALALFIMSCSDDDGAYEPQGSEGKSSRRFVSITKFFCMAAILAALAGCTQFANTTYSFGPEDFGSVTGAKSSQASGVVMVRTAESEDPDCSTGLPYGAALLEQGDHLTEAQGQYSEKFVTWLADFPIYCEKPALSGDRPVTIGANQILHAIELGRAKLTAAAHNLNRCQQVFAEQGLARPNLDKISRRLATMLASAGPRYAAFVRVETEFEDSYAPAERMAERFMFTHDSIDYTVAYRFECHARNTGLEKFSTAVNVVGEVLGALSGRSKVTQARSPMERIIGRSQGRLADL